MRGLIIRLPVQPAEVGLPPGGNASQQDGVVHGRDQGERGGGNGRPEHPAADDGSGHSNFDTIPNLCGAVTGEETLKGEVVGAEDRGVDDLVDTDFCDECQKLVGIVKITCDEKKPSTDV